MPLLLRLKSALTGRKVGTDRFGNVYFEGRRKQPTYDRHRRWVIYAESAEATRVPPEWHAWLHHTTAEPLPEGKRYPWQREHQPNLTGTAAAWRPLGSDLRGGARRPASGDYEAWTPGD